MLRINCLKDSNQAWARLKFWPSPFSSYTIHFWFDFLCSIHVPFRSSLILSIQGENGGDFQSGMTQNEAKFKNCWGLTVWRIQIRHLQDQNIGPLHSVHLPFSSGLILSGRFMYRSIPFWFYPFKVKMAEITRVKWLKIMQNCKIT